MPENRILPTGKVPGDLLDRLIRTYNTPPDASVIVNASYGFDAAAVEIGGEPLLVKTDPITFASTDAARYLVAVNANDIACMGGVPRWMTVVALLPEGKTTPALVEKQFAELQHACNLEGISLIGGHTEITAGLDRTLLIGTLLGTVGPYGMLEPGKAQAGDGLWISHAAGIEGTALLAYEKAEELRAAIGSDCVGTGQALLIEPGISVSRDAQSLIKTGVVSALHDPTEGGVATAIHEIAAASDLGAEIDGAAIPIFECTRNITRHFGIDPLGLLSSGALLIAAKPEDEAMLNSSMVPIERIGTLTDTAGTVTITTERGVEDLPRYDSDEITRALA